MSSASRTKCTLFIGGLSPSVNSQTLHTAFLPFGEIVEVNLPKPDLPSSTDPHRGFGYVEFENLEDAREAIDNMDQSELCGRIIKVSSAKERKEGVEGLGSKTAIWEQEGYLAKHAVSEEDRATAHQENGDDEELDPMQGLEQLDSAGPKEQ